MFQFILHDGVLFTLFFFAIAPITALIATVFALTRIKPNACRAYRKAGCKGRELPAGEWQRLNGAFEIVAHPESAFAASARELFQNGWMFGGINERGLWVFIDTKPHPYYVRQKALRERYEKKLSKLK